MPRRKVVCIDEGTPRRLTPGLLAELISVHSLCVHDQEGRCPLLVSIASLCWEINLALGLGNEEDRGFRRVDPMCAARPLGRDRFEEEDVFQPCCESKSPARKPTS